MNRCQLLRKRMSESRSIRTAVLAMAQDRFTPEEIAIGLKCELSEVLTILFADKRRRQVDFRELCGIAPNATGELSSEEFMGRLRDGWY